MFQANVEVFVSGRTAAEPGFVYSPAAPSATEFTAPPIPMSRGEPIAGCSNRSMLKLRLVIGGNDWARATAGTSAAASQTSSTPLICDLALGGRSSVHVFI